MYVLEDGGIIIVMTTSKSIDQFRQYYDVTNIYGIFKWNGFINSSHRLLVSSNVFFIPGNSYERYQCRNNGWEIVFMILFFMWNNSFTDLQLSGLRFGRAGDDFKNDSVKTHIELDLHYVGESKWEFINQMLILLMDTTNNLHFMI